jgi:hypothetical protein
MMATSIGAWWDGLRRERIPSRRCGYSNAGSSTKSAIAIAAIATAALPKPRARCLRLVGFHVRILEGGRAVPVHAGICFSDTCRLSSKCVRKLRITTRFVSRFHLRVAGNGERLERGAIKIVGRGVRTRATWPAFPVPQDSVRRRSTTVCTR